MSIQVFETEVDHVTRTGVTRSSIAKLIALAMTSIPSDDAMLSIILRNLQLAPPTCKLTVFYILDGICRAARDRLEEKRRNAATPEASLPTPPGSDAPLSLWPAVVSVDGESNSGTYATFLEKVGGQLSKVVVESWKVVPLDHREKMRLVLSIWIRAATFDAKLLAGIESELLAIEISTAASLSNTSSAIKERQQEQEVTRIIEEAKGGVGASVLAEINNRLLAIPQAFDIAGVPLRPVSSPQQFKQVPPYQSSLEKFQQVPPNQSSLEETMDTNPDTFQPAVKPADMSPSSDADKPPDARQMVLKLLAGVPALQNCRHSSSSKPPAYPSSHRVNLNMYDLTRGSVHNKGNGVGVSKTSRKDLGDGSKGGRSGDLSTDVGNGNDGSYNHGSADYLSVQQGSQYHPSNYNSPTSHNTSQPSHSSPQYSFRPRSPTLFDDGPHRKIRRRHSESLSPPVTPLRPHPLTPTSSVPQKVLKRD